MNDWIELGRVSGVFGVKGWIKIHSYTRERDGPLEYNSWQLKCGEVISGYKVEQGRIQSKGLIAKLREIDDRTMAESLIGCEIVVTMAELKKIELDEYYWRDLIGLSVVTTEGTNLGKIVDMMETGANDVMILGGEIQRLLPFTANTVISVDLDDESVIVDWDPEF